MTDLAGPAAAAILLSLVGEAEAATLVGHLTPDEVAMLCHGMAALDAVVEPQIDAVLGDFIVRARTQNAVARSGSAPVRTAIERSLGPVRARAILKGQDDEHPVFAELAWLPEADIVELVAEEHPQVAAIVLGKLAPHLAARALAALPDDEQADLLHRVATLGPIGSDALDALALVIGARTSTMTALQVELGGARCAAAILNSSERTLADRTWKAVSRIDKPLAALIDEARVTIDDVLALTDRDLGTVVRSVDGAILARAMKGLDAATADRFLAAMSTRAAQTLRDEIDELGSVSRAEVESAQMAIVLTLRRLRDDGSVEARAQQADYV